MTVMRGRVSGSGRLSIPAEFRKGVGLERGGDVVVELDGREIRIRTVGEVIAQAQALTRQLIGDKPEAPSLPSSPNGAGKRRVNDHGGT
jgi:bifunctional DNA-binding transcriptional regulator/antitoxin component of YhaV-PrlF toxin-antitoxin module